jgi:hypothetical protein
VTNDGFLNIYTIDSKFGSIRAVSTDILYKRIAELNAIGGMEKIRTTDEFKTGFTEKAGDFIEGGIALITDPVGAVSGAVSGVASVFSAVSKTLQYGQSETESSRLSAITGFALTRRNYAAAFNVDIYSRNEFLQKELNEISRASFLGKTLVRIGSVVVGGAAATALSVAGDVEALNELLWRKSAGELRAFIELTSKNMGVGDNVIKLFIENRNYTLTQQVALMLALESMDETTNRAAFVKFSALVDNVDMAGFRRRQAEMYATYNEVIDPLSAFQILGQVAFARTADGGVLFAAPLDHMLWTNDLAEYVRWADGRINTLEDVDSKRFWTAGSISALTRQEMEKMGWQIREKISTAALKK